jgi:hypothetical protein
VLDEIVNTLQAPKKWLWGMLPGLHDEQTGEAYTGAQVAHNAFGTDPEGVWGKALGLGLDIAGDPLNLIGAGVGRAIGGLGKLAGVGGEAATAAAEAGGGAYSAMRPLRQTFGMVKGVQPLPAEFADEAIAAMNAGTGGRMVADQAGKFVGQSTGPIRSRLLAGEALAQDAADVGGAFYPKAGFGIAEANPLTARHETIHGLIDAATKSGNSAGLPLAMRVPAALQGSSSPFLQGWGNLLNEAAAHSGAVRGYWPQLGEYANFLLNPDSLGRAGYVAQAAEKSPLAAAMFQTMPYMAPATAAGGTYLATRPLFGD